MISAVTNFNGNMEDGACDTDGTGHSELLGSTVGERQQQPLKRCLT